jgi:CubicO group peptidase (beta-lactamase class C family)
VRRCPPHPARAVRFDVPTSPLPRAAPEEVGVDGRLLDELILAAERATSDTLVLVRDGKVLIDRRGRDEPIETRSITKGLAALGVLALVDDRVIDSIDVPLSRFFPEFAEGPKAAITLRHVLSHTSGLRHSATDADTLNAQGDRTRYARGLSVVTPPGTVFSYSNEASQLLSGVIEAASGRPADELIRARVLAPLGIVDVPWKRDRAGNAQTYYGASLRAWDLARIGLMIAAGGDSKENVLSASAVDQLFTPSERYAGYGLSFWLDPPWQQSPEALANTGLPPDVRLRLADLNAVPFPSGEGYFAAARERVGHDVALRLRELHRKRKGPLVPAPGLARSLIALGGLGQRLEVHRETRLVAVRQHVRRPEDKHDEDRATFRAMQEHLYRLEAPCLP